MCILLLFEEVLWVAVWKLAKIKNFWTTNLTCLLFLFISEKKRNWSLQVEWWYFLFIFVEGVLDICFNAYMFRDIMGVFVCVCVCELNLLSLCRVCLYFYSQFLFWSLLCLILREPLQLSFDSFLCGLSFCHPFVLNQSLSFYLKWVSRRQPIVRSFDCCHSHLMTSVFQLMCLGTFYFNVILDVVGYRSTLFLLSPFFCFSFPSFLPCFGLFDFFLSILICLLDK